MQQEVQNGLNNNLKQNNMKTYTNTVIINGEKFTNKVEAENYKEALRLHKEQKRKSINTFEGRLILS